jgi:hypothetical protein
VILGTVSSLSGLPFLYLHKKEVGLMKAVVSQLFFPEVSCNRGFSKGKTLFIQGYHNLDCSSGVVPQALSFLFILKDQIRLQ